MSILRAGCPSNWERRWEDNPVHDSYYPEDGEKKVQYTEGIFVGYRGLRQVSSGKPLFPVRLRPLLHHLRLQESDGFSGSGSDPVDVPST